MTASNLQQHLIALLQHRQSTEGPTRVDLSLLLCSKQLVHFIKVPQISLRGSAGQVWSQNSSQACDPTLVSPWRMSCSCSCHRQVSASWCKRSEMHCPGCRWWSPYSRDPAGWGLYDCLHTWIKFLDSQYTTIFRSQVSYTYNKLWTCLWSRCLQSRIHSIQGVLMPCLLVNDNAVSQTCCPSVGSQLDQLDAFAWHENVGALKDETVGRPTDSFRVTRVHSFKSRPTAGAAALILFDYRINEQISPRPFCTWIWPWSLSSSLTLAWGYIYAL